MSRTGPSPLAIVENAAVGAALCGMAVVVLLQIGSRVASGSALSWTTEVATDLLVWSAFLGFAIAVRERGHVALSVLEERLRGRALHAVRLGQLVVFAFLLGALVYGGIAMIAGESGVVSPSGIPRWAVFAAVPVGAGLALIHVAVQAYGLTWAETAKSETAGPADTAGGAL